MAVAMAARSSTAAAHSIGRSHCNSSATTIFMACARNPNYLQFLDVRTPDRLDNQYYWDLLNGQGVFTSDMALMRDWRTSNIVHQFVNNPSAFLTAFSRAMVKLSVFLPKGNVCEIRQFSCARTNSGRVAKAASDEGLAASA